MREVKVVVTSRAARVAMAAAFLLSSVLAFSQDDEEMPFPFVSLLKAQPAGFQIKLSWRDAPEAVASYSVYRYGQEITMDNLAKAPVIGRVDTGVQYFIDTPPDSKPYFYAVLARDSTGKIFSTLIPFRNKTLIAVSVTTPATEEQAAAQITDIHAGLTTAADAIEVTFHSSNASRDLLLFRSTSPITDLEGLLRSASATQLDAGTTKVVIPVLSGVDYWFTVLDAGLFKLGTVALTAGVNSTVDPVQVPLASGKTSLAASAPPRRLLPLPNLEITYGIQTGRPLPGTNFQGLPPARSLSAATQKSLAILLANVPSMPQKQLERTVLPADSTPSPDRDETLLQGIVEGPFIAGNAAASENQLVDFLSLRRAPDAEARAHFYLGQTYYFTDRPREALLEFLLADDSYYHEVEQWKDACFRLLEKDGTPGS
ncbi:MAG TPA: hypothetical protein VL354_18750 [Spirochaetia bacterium]|nr:hypothetical protein [Spirochaetia bacterium]